MELVDSGGADQRARGGALPNVVIIGAQKCGTTALHSYMARHPSISMSSPKELNFFIDDRREGSWHRGLDWYRSHFDSDAEIRGESSPNYTADPLMPGVPERMARVIPDAKLILLVRDPIERVRAGYVHHYANRVEKRGFAEAVLAPDSPYVWRSRYHHQLDRWLEHYPLERILVIAQEELRKSRRPTLKLVWRFLGVRENVWREGFRKRRLKTEDIRRRTALGALVADHVSHVRWRQLQRYRFFARPFEPPEIDAEVHAALADLLREDAKRFREVTGQSFPQWSI
jgi:Sulfotransferase domain